MVKTSEKSEPVVVESQDFKERKELYNLEKEIIELRHEYKMKELKYQRDNDKIHHENEMERQRIRSAEIQRTIARKEQFRRNKNENKYDNNMSYYQP